MTIDDFEFMYVIGKGGYGKVWKVKDKITRKYFALKQMTKARILEEKSEISVLNERYILAKMHSPFVINLLYSFQNQNNLFLVMALLTGGDLRYHLLNYKFFFTETQLKFLMTNLILAIEYIHKKKIVHRDLKPENIIFNTQGYLKVTDFGISVELKKIDKSDDSGTPAYMAPETIKGEDQNFCVDYYSIGVIGYEIMKGNVPYDSNDREEIKRMMKQRSIVLDRGDKLRTKYSTICLDFFTRLLKQNPKERLGSNYGEKEIKQHSFFTGINWKLIKKQRYISPLYDVIRYSRMKNGYSSELFDFEYCNAEEEISPEKAEFYINLSKSFNFALYFKYYTCVCVKNIVREFKRDEKRHKKLSKSSSMSKIYSKNKNNHNKHRHNYLLPYIVNSPTEIYNQNLDFKSEKYYQKKLLNYQHNLAKLKYEYLLKKDQLKNMNYPFIFKKSSRNNNNLGFFQNYKPLLETPYLPMIDLNKNNYMNNIMPPLISPEQNNFFVGNNKMLKSYNYENDDDDDSDIFSDESDEENKGPSFYNGIYYYDPFWYDQSMKEKKSMENESLTRNNQRYHTKRKSKLIKEEMNTEKHREDEK